MLILSDRFTSASGSIGGTTASHNRFGLYVRARRVPVNPNTAAQQAQRNAFGTYSGTWRTLTEAQRDAWEAYAAATPVTNRLGQTVFLSGQQSFVAAASLAARLGGAVPLAAPPTPGHVPIGVPTIVIDASALSVAIALLDAAADGEIGVFVGDPQSAGVKFFAGPYQLIGAASPTAGAFTLTPVSGRNGLAFATGQRIPYRIRGVDQNGALTTVATGITTVVA